MRKSLLSAIVVLMLLTIGCSQPTKWTDDERVEFAATIDNYRDMVYLNEFNNAEFVLFANNISTDVERSYPIYSQLVVMPSYNDSLDMWVVASIIEDIDADATSLRYLYPYRTLINQGILADSLSVEQLNDFYRCLSGKINNNYESVENFFYKVLTNDVESSQIERVAKECCEL
ncbi:MAG: hypothetical protein R3Y08_00255 [Rikenellaceae bacterium]